VAGAGVATGAGAGTGGGAATSAGATGVKEKFEGPGL
jgi:hypothetical protein